MGQAIKNVLKFVFGRTWPETWIANNPSFIHSHVLASTCFMGGLRLHVPFRPATLTATCALLSVLWIRYPRFQRRFTCSPPSPWPPG